jgi:hypothetical protein
MLRANDAQTGGRGRTVKVLSDKNAVMYTGGGADTPCINEARADTLKDYDRSAEDAPA